MCFTVLEVKRPRFSGTSYLALPTLRNAHRSLQIILEFKPEVFEGVLLYSGQEPGLEGDFVAIVISQGFIEFRCLLQMCITTRVIDLTGC